MKKSRTGLFLFLCLFLRDTNSTCNVEEIEVSRMDIEEPSYTTENTRNPSPKVLYEEESEPEEGPASTATIPNTIPDTKTDINNINNTSKNVITEEQETRDDSGATFVENSEPSPVNVTPINTDVPVTTTDNLNLDPPAQPVETAIEENKEKDPETTKGAFLDFLEKKEPEEDGEIEVAAVKKENIVVVEAADITDKNSDTDTDSEEDDSDIGSDIEHLRSILSSLQQVLLFVAAGTFSFIVLYTAFYINILRKIYSRTTTCIKKKNK